jgi:hypothetical protein
MEAAVARMKRMEEVLFLVVEEQILQQLLLLLAAEELRSATALAVKFVFGQPLQGFNK